MGKRYRRALRWKRKKNLALDLMCGSPYDRFPRYKEREVEKLRQDKLVSPEMVRFIGEDEAIKNAKKEFAGSLGRALVDMGYVEINTDRDRYGMLRLSAEIDVVRRGE